MAKRKNSLEQKMEMFLVNDELGRENLRLKARIRELETELAVRDNMGNEVLRILREATGRRDFHSELEAVEWAARMILDLQTQLFLEKQSAKEAIGREAAATSREIGLKAELAEARRDAARYHHIRTASLIHWESGKIHNRISWPTIFAAEPVDGGNYRDRFDAAIDAAMKEAK